MTRHRAEGSLIGYTPRRRLWQMGISTTRGGIVKDDGHTGLMPNLEVLRGCLQACTVTELEHLRPFGRWGLPGRVPDTTHPISAKASPGKHV